MSIYRVLACGALGGIGTRAMARGDLSSMRLNDLATPTAWLNLAHRRYPMTTNTRSTYPDAVPGLPQEARRLIREAADQLDAQWDLDAASGLHDGNRFSFPGDPVGSGRFYGDELMPKLRALIGEPPLRLRDPDGYAAREAARGRQQGDRSGGRGLQAYARLHGPLRRARRVPGQCVGSGSWQSQRRTARKESGSRCPLARDDLRGAATREANGALAKPAPPTPPPARRMPR